MATKNDVTGDAIRSKVDGASKYAKNFDQIFATTKSLTWSHECPVKGRWTLKSDTYESCPWCDEKASD